MSRISRFIRGDVDAPVDPRTGAPVSNFVTVSDLAWCAFEADPDVREVVIHNCYPAPGSVTVEIKGGDPARVATDLADRRPLNLAVHVHPYTEVS